MKMLSAVIKPFKLDDVKQAVRDAGVKGMTVTEVRGFGRQAGHTEVYRGHEYAVDFVPKLRIDILCEDGQIAGLSDAIMKAARTGKIGDGKIFVVPVEEVYRIRTGEAGEDAI